MEYKPRPIDTSGVTLSEDVLELTELLAKNTHEIWARQRLSERWRYGAQRDDERREHPGLVSYEELSEVEKQYDRNTALETLKTIISLGYRIEPPARRAHTDAAHHHDAAPASDIQAVLETLKQPGALTLGALLAIWQAREPARWARSAEVYQRLGARLLKLGEMLLAYDVFSEGLKPWPGDLRLRQLQAHALTRLGATERANALLRALYDEGQRDEETVGMLARTHKDLWQQAADPVERERQLQLSYKFYEEAYRLSGGYWTGINAATIALLSGRRDDARALAAEVRALCLAELRREEETGADRYWTLATLGEAALVSEDWPEAARRYDEALTEAPRQLGELTSTRRNARLIIEYLGGDPAFIERHLPVPKVVVFAGHEACDWQVPPETEAAVRQMIFERLNELGAGVGYTVVPAPCDAAFLEAMLEAGGETHAVLPCGLNELLKAEHDGGDSHARARYESILGRVTSVVAASEQNMAVGGMSGEYSRLLLHGLALIRAKQLDTELVPLALLDGYAATDAAAAEAQPAANASPVAGETTGERVGLIELSRLARPQDNDASAPTSDAGFARDAPADAADGFNARMVALLFADAVNFSKLTEAQIPIFVRDFLGAVGSLVARFQPAPLLRNTWGDGLYLVFEDVQAAGRFALDLSDLLNAADWTRRGLPADLNLRIALHAGPVYACTDPVTQKDNFIGTHVSRAARLEPITPPGQVYASQAFAALAAAQHVQGFTCDYVGQTPLAKKYGTFPTYHVRRTQKLDA
ncbi:MAG TPA: TRAFs-binding domain-containing protein [Pyrinomonadaceae bacterium]|nr:TRAFs-binding domain-containing protein [Pyrinomonadaceae bacterium]